LYDLLYARRGVPFPQGTSGWISDCPGRAVVVSGGIKRIGRAVAAEPARGGAGMTIIASGAKALDAAVAQILGEGRAALGYSGGHDRFGTPLRGRRGRWRLPISPSRFSIDCVCRTMTANVIATGRIATGTAAGCFATHRRTPEQHESAMCASGVCACRMGRSEAPVGHAADPCSQRAGFINGETISVSGAMLASLIQPGTPGEPTPTRDPATKERT
jgi:NAD(P)-dependent dehydrogenase (short-subunit alcohol dehydrogenase family)